MEFLLGRFLGFLFFWGGGRDALLTADCCRLGFLVMFFCRFFCGELSQLGLVTVLFVRASILIYLSIHPVYLSIHPLSVPPFFLFFPFASLTFFLFPSPSHSHPLIPFFSFFSFSAPLHSTLPVLELRDG